MPRGLCPSLRDVARFRQGAYRLLGAVFLDCQERTVVAVAEAAAYLRRRGAWAATLGFYGSWDRFLRCAGGLTPCEAQKSYWSVFSGGTRAVAHLYESAYLDQSRMSTGWLLAQLDNEYATAGLRLSSSQREAPDHVSVELEFVSFLCGLEVEAWETKNVGGALRAICQQRSFLERHPCQWFASLARAVMARDGSGVYSSAVQAARALVAHDVDFLEALAASVRREAEIE